LDRRIDIQADLSIAGPVEPSAGPTYRYPGWRIDSQVDVSIACPTCP